MIAKKYRLTENEVKKVLKKKKPFFAYKMVANTVANGLTYARIGVILNKAQTKGSVNRNSLRRTIYNLSYSSIDSVGMDIVYTFKKKIFLDSKDATVLTEIKKDIGFLLSKIKEENKYIYSRQNLYK